MDPDVLVVGAGPAGSTVAERLATRGHRVLVVEEHARVGFPVQCAGLVSQRVLGLAASTSMVRTAVRGATVFGPSLGSVSFKAVEPRAFVIDRGALDVHLADRAARAGAEFRTSTRFDRLLGTRGWAESRAPHRAGPQRPSTSGHDWSLARTGSRARSLAPSVSDGPSRSCPAFEAEFPGARATPRRSRST